MNNTFERNCVSFNTFEDIGHLPLCFIMLTAEKNDKVVVTHLAIVIDIQNNDQLSAKEKVFGRSIL